MKVTCAICGKKTESNYSGVKYCGNCGIWLCHDHGSGKKQCPKCMKYTLK